MEIFFYWLWVSIFCLCAISPPLKVIAHAVSGYGMWVKARWDGYSSIGRAGYLKQVEYHKVVYPAIGKMVMYPNTLLAKFFGKKPRNIWNGFYSIPAGAGLLMWIIIPVQLTTNRLLRIDGEFVRTSYLEMHDLSFYQGYISAISILAENFSHFLYWPMMFVVLFGGVHVVVLKVLNNANRIRNVLNKLEKI